MSISNKYEKTSQPVISEGPQNVLLRVTTSDEMAEVFILNSKLDLVDRGIGRIYEKNLDPGIYKVKIRSGSQIKEELVTLSGNDPIFDIRFEPLTIVSAAPINDTAKTHEFHIGNAEAHSKSSQVHVNAGVGSSIFVFARCWTAKEKKDSRKLMSNPAKGLSLHDANGHLVADIEHLSSKSQNDWDPWAACHIRVNPGLYCLSLELADKSRIEQTVVASHDWQTQLFFLQRNYGTGDKLDWRADLAGGSILMSRKGDGFDAGQNNLRLDELARLALANNRNILSKGVRQDLLHNKFENPMFGIYGAHLLLMSDDPDPGLLDAIINNLRYLVGHNHPDVEALALRILGDTGYVCTIPPMLRRSWGIIVEKTIERENLVPFNSLASDIATKIWGAEPFLIWQVKSPLDLEDKSQENCFKDALIQRLKLSDSQKPQAYADILPASGHEFERSESFDHELLTESMGSSLETLEPSVYSENDDCAASASEPRNFEFDYMDDEIASSNPVPTSQNTPELVRALGLPRSTVETMLNDVKPSDLL